MKDLVALFELNTTRKGDGWEGKVECRMLFAHGRHHLLNSTSELETLDTTKGALIGEGNEGVW
jgi:hypothetical protein